MRMKEVEQVNRKEVIQLVKEIIELDIRRDELYEKLMTIMGSDAYEVLRFYQNYK
ncbi:hypothetical protein [Salinibacillus xinjiangensis]|uniref:Uncharacterized protein n=1 Tax=Salinibacillus xinjiangensis TaxID=1229268 RepID=A0A6G1X4G1_9BACI|nr:hypothetical protein [Salinibacillus xinjiangensis]MRG85883.1 hypothetical protein [Salinibacillus xinjiangensis]